MIKRFRETYQFEKEQYSDDYIKDLLIIANNNFEDAMLIHLENDNYKKENSKDSVKNEEKLELLVEEFRKTYQLSPQDYPDNIIKKALKKKEGDFENAFEDLMSFIK